MARRKKAEKAEAQVETEAPVEGTQEADAVAPDVGYEIDKQPTLEASVTDMTPGHRVRTAANLADMGISMLKDLNLPQRSEVAAALAGFTKAKTWLAQLVAAGVK